MLACAAVMTLSVAAAPVADLWPYAVKRGAGGTLEYVYDVSVVKSAALADAKETHGAEAVAAFLQALPREARVKVSPGTSLVVSAGRGLEPNPLAKAYALVSDGRISEESALGHKPGARLRQPLDPGEPKVLVSSELALWLVRTLEESSLAAVEVDTEWMRRELWGKVAERVAARARTASGDVREGALAVAARVAAANACLDPSKLHAAVSDRELLTAADLELARLRRDPDAFAAPPPWSWTPELTCGWVRTRALGQPLENTRAGTAGILVFLDVVAKDDKLRAFWERIRVRRDRFVGPPASERINAWRDAANGQPAKALDSLGEFIEKIPQQERVPPPLMALSQTPFSKFCDELTGPERVAMIDELASAVGDGRVSPASTPPSWPVAREAALAALTTTESLKQVQFDSAWRDRLTSAFAALQGAHRDVRGPSNEPTVEQGERTELTVRLNVPPSLDAEPTPVVFERAAQSLEALVAAITADNLTGLKPFTPDGKRGGDTIVNMAKRWIPTLHGLAKLAAPDATALDGKDVAEARAFIATWRSELALTKDLRVSTASPYAIGSERTHSAIIGVGRRELSVTFGAKPKAELDSKKGAFTLNTEAEQRYIVPVLVTIAATVPLSTKPLDRELLRAAIEAADRDKTKSEGAFLEALNASPP